MVLHQKVDLSIQGRSFFKLEQRTEGCCYGRAAKNSVSCAGHLNRPPQISAGLSNF